MLYIKLENFVPVEVSAEYPKCKGDGKVWAFKPKTPGKYDEMVNSGTGWITRNDIGSFAYAKTLADLLTAKLGVLYLGTDEGSSTSPRYAVIKAPAIGDEVSASFNGDTYPEGTITRITPKFLITTSTGVKFRRVKESGGFRKVNGYSWMVGGHINERNPHF